MNVSAADQLITQHPSLAAYREQLGGKVGAETGAASQARSDEGGGPLAGTREPYLTIDGLKKAWGETDSSYDLNDDGTVNVSDLLALLAEGGTMTDPNAPITMDGLMKDWGTTDSIYDLDFDGTVNVNDLLALLAAGGEMASPPSPPPTESRIAAPTSDDRGDSTAPLMSPIDKPDSKSAAAPLAATTSAASLSEPANPQKTESAVRTMSDLLISRLEKAGYTHRPPANVHGIVDQFNFKSEHRQSIIDRIAQRYPNGLGIQVRA